MPVLAEASPEAQHWAPLVDAETAARALGVASRVASRLRDRALLLQINQRASAQSRYPDTLRWSPCSIAHGDASLALASAVFDRAWPGSGWPEIGSAYLLQALAAARLINPPAGLFSGLAGVGFAALLQRELPAPQQEALPFLYRAIGMRALEMAGRLHDRQGVAVSEIDVISGLSGIGACLLAAGVPAPTDVALQALLDALVALSGATNGTPHSFTPRALMGENPMADAFPRGNVNCGLAHGLPGPLALMAIAMQEGIEVDGMAEAIERSAAWLVRQQTQDAYGINWPTAVPLSAEGRCMPAPAGSRAAWCYGAPGVARALWLAGRAVDDDSLCELAVQAMQAIYRRPIALRQIDSPTFCHGIAGLLQITLRFAHDTGLPVFREAAQALCTQLLANYRDEHALGYCSIEPEGNRVDQSGVLDGAAGVAMVLLAAASDQAPGWDRAFLLS